MPRSKTTGKALTERQMESVKLEKGFYSALVVIIIFFSAVAVFIAFGWSVVQRIELWRQIALVCLFIFALIILIERWYWWLNLQISAKKEKSLND